MAEMQTRPTGEAVTAFLDSVPDERRRAEGHAVRELIERVTGAPAELWGPTMIGFGTMPYQNKTTSGETFPVGFSPRKGALTFYGLYNDYGPPDPLFDQLGPHTTGKGCLYLKHLDAVDAAVLEQLVREAWERRPGA